MYKKKQQKAKNPLPQTAISPQRKPASQVSTAASTGQRFDPYTKQFMGSFLNTLEQSEGKAAVAKAISNAKRGKPDTRLH